MYEEKEFTFKYIIIRILLILLFVFLLMWLLPMPNVKPLTSRIFNDNIGEMSDAAKSYYTAERLPKTVGDKTSLTLAEMIEKKMVLPFVDENGDYCDNSSSYVEITKMDKEYVLKTFLACKGQSDYKIEYIGCSAQCTLPCEQPKTEEVAAVVEEKGVIVTKTAYVPTYVPTPKPATPKPVTPKPTTPKVEPQYVTYYEYSNTTYSDWTNWTKTRQSASSTLEVDTKTETSYDYNNDYITQSNIYRTVMYVSKDCLQSAVNNGGYSQCMSESERFILEDVPYDATNLRVTNVTTFTSSDYNTYLNGRNNHNLRLHQVDAKPSWNVSYMSSNYKYNVVPSNAYSRNVSTSSYYDGSYTGSYNYNNENSYNNYYNSGNTVYLNWAINNPYSVLNSSNGAYVTFNNGTSEYIYYVPVKFTVSYRTTEENRERVETTYYRTRTKKTTTYWDARSGLANPTGRTKQERIN